MLSISRGFRPTEPIWQQFNVTAVFRAVPGPGEFAPIGVLPGTTFWIPPAPGFIRGFTLNVDETDPLVAVGATLLSIGLRDTAAVGSAAELALIRQLPTSVYNGPNHRLLGWGNDGAGVAVATGVGLADSGLVVCPLGSVPGQPTLSRTIAAISNAGTYTGTLRCRFEYRPFREAW